MEYSLDIRNIGPIRHTHSTLRAFNIVVGANNSGKSIHSEIMYAMLTIHRAALNEATSHTYRSLAHVTDIPPEMFRNTPPQTSRDVILPWLARTWSGAVDKAYSREVRATAMGQVESFLSEKPAEMLLNPARSGRIEFGAVSELGTFRIVILLPRGKHARISARFAPDSDAIRKQFEGTLTKELGSDVDNILRTIITGSTNVEVHPDKRLALTLSRGLADLFYLVGRRRAASPRPYYLPAGRGGLIEGYRTVVKAWAGLGRSAAIRRIDVPPFPGPASIFYQDVLSLRSRPGMLARLISHRMSELIGGRVELRSEEGIPGQMVFKFQSRTGVEREIDVTQASSMVKELAPLLLLLNEGPEPGSVLIFEEPESHLHPAKQIELLELLVEVARKGVLVLITTHSDLVVTRSSHLLTKGRSSSRLSSSLTLFESTERGTQSEEGTLTSPVMIASFDTVLRQLLEEESKLEAS